MPSLSFSLSLVTITAITTPCSIQSRSVAHLSPLPPRAASPTGSVRAVATSSSQTFAEASNATATAVAAAVAQACGGNATAAASALARAVATASARAFSQSTATVSVQGAVGVYALVRVHVVSGV